MISTEKINEFKTLFSDFKKLSIYADRQNQKLIGPLFKEIISETLKNKKITNEHLTGLIQMFGWRCSADNFKKYMELCVPDKKRCRELISQSEQMEQRGFTNIGKTAITNLSHQELKSVRDFLLSAFNVESMEHAITLCRNFEVLNIPQVKQGIFSPWLFYINPSVFPLVNNSHNNFKKHFGVSKNYSDSISEYHQFKEVVNEVDFAGIDYFAHILTEEGTLNYRRYLTLNGKKLYKISHGIFSKDFKKSGVWEQLKANNWICLDQETKKGQGDAFVNDLAIGDYVYLCYGGDELGIIGEIVSEAKPLPNELKKALNGTKVPWIYREVKLVFEPNLPWLAPEMKQLRNAYMPSGYWTFSRVPEDDLEWINEQLFIPYYNVTVRRTEENNKEERGVDLYNSVKNDSMIANNIILYGPPGTGKTFHSITYALSIIEGTDLQTLKSECKTENGREQLKNRYDEFVASGNIVFTTFHQSLSYEDFIEGIKPLEPSPGKPMQYDVVDGIFKKICNDAVENLSGSNKLSDTFEDVIAQLETAWLDNKSMPFKLSTAGKEFTLVEFKTKNIPFKKSGGSTAHSLSKKTLKELFLGIRTKFPTGLEIYYHSLLNKLDEYKKNDIETSKSNEPKPANFVLIIDEINRGNVSQIFGELITLIEPDKRLGAREEIRVTLPYSNEEFVVPSNVFIVGTMNTADRSVEALDTALRRRFSFVPMMPKEDELTPNCEGINLQLLLKTINDRLKVLKDKDHTIGHAWLWNVNTLDDLRLAFKDKIIPLLQEYFYNDYEKLGLVLGDSFVEEEVTGNASIFATFTGGSGLRNQYNNKKVFKITDAVMWGLDSFKSIYQSHE